MDLKNLTPKQLDRLALAAREELQRLRNRKPLPIVQQLLRDAAAAEGYWIGDVFPEFTHPAPPAAAPQPVDVSSVAADPFDAQPRAGSRPVAPPAVETAVAEPVAIAPTKKTAEPRPAAEAQDDPAERLVRALASRGAAAVGMASSIADLLASVGMQQEWPAFHAALESAARRNWIHFRGNDHCVLTETGFAAVS